MSHVYCPECGFQNPETANYCAKCGALLATEESGEPTMTFTPEDSEEEGQPALEDFGIKGPALVVRSGGGRAGETFTLDARAHDDRPLARLRDLPRRRHRVAQARGRWSARAMRSGSRISAASTERSSTASASTPESSRTATSCRSASTASPSSNERNRDTQARTAAHHRRGVRPAEARVPGRLDQQDQISGGRGVGHTRREHRAATGCSAKRTSTGWRRSCGCSATSSCRCA